MKIFENNNVLRSTSRNIDAIRHISRNVATIRHISRSDGAIRHVSRNATVVRRISVLLCVAMLAIAFGPAGAPMWQSGAHAAGGSANPIEIRLNGYRLASDVPPVLRDSRTFVPIRVIAEAVGFEVNYNEESQTVMMNHALSNTLITMNVGMSQATINSAVVDMPVPVFVESGRTMVPVRFISEALNSHVEWRPGYNSPDIVIINCPHPVYTYGKKAQIASRTENKFWEEENPYFGTVTIGYDITIPVFTIPGGEPFAKKLNDEFDLMLRNSIDSINEIYGDQIANGTESVSGATDEFIYNISYDDGNLLSLNIEGNAYYGGAHGMPYIHCYNLDLNKREILGISDVFKPGIDYESILTRRMIAMCASDPDEYGDLFDDPDTLEEGSFYFEDGDLVLFYHPYALSSFARGFVEFRIPLASLSEFIRDEYL